MADRFLREVKRMHQLRQDINEMTPEEADELVRGLLNKEINACLTDAKMKARLADLGETPFPGSPADFGKLIADETEKWARVIRAANIKPE